MKQIKFLAYTNLKKLLENSTEKCYLDDVNLIVNYDIPTNLVTYENNQQCFDRNKSKKKIIVNLVNENSTKQINITNIPILKMKELPALLDTLL